MPDLKNAKLAIPLVVLAGLLWSFGPLVVRNMDNPGNVPWQYLFARGLVIFTLLNIYLYFEEGLDFYKNYLRIGIYQIFWLDRVPGHAAVNETVALARKCDIGTASGFVNAVLRNSLRKESALRKQLEELKQSNPSIAHSHPDWLLHRWQVKKAHPPFTQKMNIWSVLS